MEVLLISIEGASSKWMEEEDCSECGIIWDILSSLLYNTKEVSILVIILHSFVVIIRGICVMMSEYELSLLKRWGSCVVDGCKDKRPKRDSLEFNYDHISH